MNNFSVFEIVIIIILFIMGIDNIINSYAKISHIFGGILIGYAICMISSHFDFDFLIKKDSVINKLINFKLKGGYNGNKKKEKTKRK